MSSAMPVVMVAPQEGELFPMLRLTTRYDERYSNLYIRLEQGENLQMLFDKKISAICIKVLRLLNGCKEEVGQQTETLAGEVNQTFSGSKQMSMEVRKEDVKNTSLVIVVTSLGVFGREADEVGSLHLSIEHLLSTDNSRAGDREAFGEGEEATQSFMLLRCDRSLN